MNKNANLAQRFEENKARKERWAHLSEGVKDDYRRIVLENLLDQQKAFMEANDTTAFGSFTTFAFPLIRRIFPNLIANDLVSVQPIDMPTAMIFFLDFMYSNTVAPTVAKDRADYQGGKFNPYYGSGARGEVPTGTIDGANKDFTSKIKPICNVIAYVDAVKVSISTFDSVTGVVTLVSAPTAGKVVTLDYDFAYEGTDIAPEVEFAISSDSVTATETRLKARWTLEGQQDLMAYHGVDAETELTAFLSDEIRRELDRMVVNDLYSNIGTNVNWASTYPGTNSGYSKNEYNATLFEAMVDAGNAIYKKRLVKPNWVLASPDVCARMEKMNGFRFVGDGAGGTVQKGINMFGTVAGKYNIYSDPQAPADKILMGYKGNQFFEAGYVFAPYVPLYATPVIMDTDFKPRRALMSRNARKKITSDYYATVTIQ